MCQKGLRSLAACEQVGPPVGIASAMAWQQRAHAVTTAVTRRDVILPRVCFTGHPCANNGKGANINTPETLLGRLSSPFCSPVVHLPSVTCLSAPKAP
eukprot:558858-Prorocentrum_minimum.AAC.1